ncbi:MAG TPA: UDP-N-acetylglucosamine 2-epimerase (non-hydrolyzing) [Phycisphaerales bacterium]|nr:UDP-N-acetylglucosamine 2-epimerase (non-hydrolyzing) [Phycisphaerales bacterium]HRQ76379.1 UDP-N-acetylglucosamine 2-epimerase (non-hydrolyzing) [Phycisphaerales bacterium]
MIVHSIVGARPQFVKAAVVSRALRANSIREILTHTGQHYDSNMSDVFFESMDIPKPDHHLGIGSGRHGQQTGRMLEHIESLLVANRPDWVLVYGDTNSTLAGALAASKLHIPVAHVEAGLRSFNRLMPEEVNRVLTDHVSDLLFAPTKTAVGHLRREGIADKHISLVGDVMYDAMLFYSVRAQSLPSILDVLSLEPRKFVLATIHRAENTDDPERLHGIVDGLCRAARHLPVVLPLHPRTRQALMRAHLLEQADCHLQIIEPVDYLQMIQLESRAAVIATDSGGVQKEAFFHGVRCVTMRDETEWVELVEAGVNDLVGTDATAIERAILAAQAQDVPQIDLYGDGNSASKIVRCLMQSAQSACLA